MKTKICAKCGQEKPATTEYWHKFKDCKYGLHSQCKECKNKDNAKWREGNKESIAEVKKQWYIKNKEKKNETDRLWRENNVEYCIEQSKKYQKENLDVFRRNNQKRRARKRKLQNTLTVKQWTIIKNDFNNQCAYCGREMKRLEQDHFIALSKGGEYTHNNIVPACRTCNARKNDKDFFEWYPKQVGYSKEREKKILEYLNYKDEGIQQLALY